MPTFITRLRLVNGKNLQLGHLWPDEPDSYPVSLIIERPEESVQTGGSDDEEGPVLTTAAHYEVWIFSDDLRSKLFDFFGKVFAGAQPPTTAELSQALGQVPNALCRRISSRSVDFVDEVWNMLEAWPIIQEFFQDKLKNEMPAEEEEDPPPINMQRTAAAQSVNGPQGA